MALTDREIDALVAEHVFGWKDIKFHEDGVVLFGFLRYGPGLYGDVLTGKIRTRKAVPTFTADTAEGWAAMRDVIEAMELRSTSPKDPPITMEFQRQKGDVKDLAPWAVTMHGPWCYATVGEDTLPKAVALAALMALGVEVE